MRFNLQQFTAVFDLRDAEGKLYVIIGGQAVNYWAETYLAKEPELAQWMPFTSKDIDFQGNRDDVLRIAKILGVRAQLPNSREMTALAGIIPFEIGDLRSNIEVVRFFPGMPKAKIHHWALTANRGGKDIRVLDPLSLLDSKVYLALKVEGTPGCGALAYHALVRPRIPPRNVAWGGSRCPVGAQLAGSVRTCAQAGSVRSRKESRPNTGGGQDGGAPASRDCDQLPACSQRLP